MPQTALCNYGLSVVTWLFKMSPLYLRNCQGRGLWSGCLRAGMINSTLDKDVCKTWALLVELSQCSVGVEDISTWCVASCYSLEPGLGLPCYFLPGHVPFLYIFIKRAVSKVRLISAPMISVDSEQRERYLEPDLHHVHLLGTLKRMCHIGEHAISWETSK